MITCSQCRIELLEVDTRKIRKCDHACCCECLVKYLKDITSPKVKCMIATCAGIVSDKLIRECLADDQIKAYEQLCIVQTSQKAIKCLTEFCPFFVVVGDDSVVFECSYCGAPNCTKCKLRHYINDCGRDTADEKAIDARALQTLKNKRRQHFEELKKKFTLIPNPNSFRCKICEEFFLPRTEVILRNCNHSLCKDCLKGSILSKDFMSQRKCPYDICDKKFGGCRKDSDGNDKEHYYCDRELDDCELFALDPERHADMMEREASCRFYQCKNEDCTGMWDATKLKGSHKCPKCSKINCLECEDIHEGMTCEEFRKTKRHLQSIKNKDKIMSNQKHVKCYVCTRQLIQKGGCGAIYCNGCGGQTCIFTGKIAGRHDPDKCYCKGEPNCTKKDQYCGCLSSNPCDKLCLYGCLPEYPK